MEYDRPYEPRESLTGTVVYHPPDHGTQLRPEPIHDSQAEVTRDGFGFGVYDPATRQTTFIDPERYPEERAS